MKKTYAVFSARLVHQLQMRSSIQIKSDVSYLHNWCGLFYAENLHTVRKLYNGLKKMNTVKKLYEVHEKAYKVRELYELREK